MKNNEDTAAGLDSSRDSFSVKSNPSPAHVDAPLDIPSITVKDTLEIIFTYAGIAILGRVMGRLSDFAINAILANSESSAEGQQDIVAAAALIGTLQRLTQAVVASWLTIYGNQVGALTKEMNDSTNVGSSTAQAEIQLRMGRLYKQSLFMSSLLWIPPTFLLLYSGRLFKLIGQPDAPSEIAQDYFNVFIYSLIPTFFNNTVQNFALSIKKPWHAFGSSFMYTLANIGFTTLFVLVKNQGYAGNAKSVGCSEGIAFLSLFIVHQISQTYRPFHLYKRPCNFLPTIDETKKFFKEGGKHAAQIGSDLLVNWVMTIIVGYKNVVNLDASQIGYQYYYLLLIPLANAVNAISFSVSEQKKPVNARRIADITLMLSFTAPLIMLIFSIIFPKQLIAPFLGKNAHSDEVVDTAKSLLWLANATLCLYLPRLTEGAYIRGLTSGTSKALKASTFSNILTLGLGGLLWVYTSLDAKSFFLARLIGEALVTPWLMREGRKIHHEQRQAALRTLSLPLLADDSQSAQSGEPDKEEDQLPSITSITAAAP